MDVERTFSVSRDVEHVFDYLSDFEHTEQWDPGTLQTRRTCGDGGLGTTYSNRSRFMGRTVNLTYETIAYDRPGYFACRGRNGRTTATDHLTFTPQDGGTQIHYRAVFDFPFPLNVAALALRGRLETLADETVARIKKTLDD